MNLIISKWDMNIHSPISIVGEMQLLLAPVLKSKSKDHEFYEIIRQTNFIRACQSSLKSNSFDSKFQNAMGNEKSLVSLFVNHPIQFNFKVNGNLNGFCQKLAKSSEIKLPFLKVFANRLKEENWMKTKLLHRVFLNKKPNETTLAWVYALTNCFKGNPNGLKRVWDYKFGK